ncbi:MAG: hypothetical protein ABI134_35235 [Byssovorax sp.]
MKAPREEPLSDSEVEACEGNLVKCVMRLHPTMLADLDEIMDMVSQAGPDNVTRAAVIRAGLLMWTESIQHTPLDDIIKAVRSGVARRGRKPRVAVGGPE